ncbi:hypothetical protein M3Y96_01113900 [Aphelenchoides besseyi]|nr:hypothetical protein M3Y96_01113900 [Aphelenchoides besseyi]
MKPNGNTELSSTVIRIGTPPPSRRHVTVITSSSSASSSPDTQPKKSSTVISSVASSASLMNTEQYRYYPDAAHLSRFDYVLLEAFRPLCAPSSMQCAVKQSHLSCSTTSDEDPSEDETNQTVTRHSIPTIVFHNSESTDNELGSEDEDERIIGTTASEGDSRAFSLPIQYSNRSFSESGSRPTVPLTPALTTKPPSSTLGRRLNKQSSVIVSAAQNAATAIQNGALRKRPPRILRRHSTFQPRLSAQSLATDSDSHVMRELLVRQKDGLEISFERCKSWSKYATHLLSFVRARLAMEHEHARSVAKLAEQTKALIASDANNNSLPLVSIFDQLMDGAIAHSSRTDQTVAMLNQRFVATLENRQKEHDNKRRKLKADWMKQKKQLDACALKLTTARQNLNSKEGGYLKARDSTIRTVQSVPPGGTVDVNRKRKELERRRKNEEDALNRKTDAEHEVRNLEHELQGRRRDVENLRLFIIGELCDLIRHCDLTTTACASHFIKAFGELWTPVEFERLAHELRDCSSPSVEFMSFLQSLPGRSISSASLLRNSASANDRNDDEIHGVAGSSSESAPSSSARRRNALNADEHYDLIAETSHRRQKKSMTRLFDHSLSSIEQSEAAKSHQLQRTRQVTRCYTCDLYCIFDAVKCSICGAIFHRKCLTNVTISCGPIARLAADSAGSRRMSIFGVPLQGHLEAQQRQIPMILEKCVDEIQRHGMTSKGIYRTCGVKSKIEQICVSFEQAGNEAEINLTDVDATANNLASVVKLYLRKLPEPLMTYELYRDWLDFDTEQQEQCLIQKLRELCDRLPQQNFDTLRFLTLHLKRVTWFEAENLMTAANLAAVISPSLIWPNTYNTGPSTPASFSSAATVSIGPQSTFINDAHRQAKVVETLIQYAFEVFDVDRTDDWNHFFERYQLPIPNPVDAKTEANLNQTMLANEVDNLSDDFENSDDEQLDAERESSTAFSQLPPTPDLLLRNKSKKAESSSEDFDNDSYSPSSLRLQAPATAPLGRQRFGKQRSFTTSILVSPQPDRKFIFSHKQRSMDNRPESVRLSLAETSKRTLRSGEGQYFLPNQELRRNSDRVPLSSHSQRISTTLDRRFERRVGNNAETEDDDSGRHSAQMDGSDSERLLDHVGVIFAGNDVSYV